MSSYRKFSIAQIERYGPYATLSVIARMALIKIQHHNHTIFQYLTCFNIDGKKAAIFSILVITLIVLTISHGSIRNTKLKPFPSLRKETPSRKRQAQSYNIPMPCIEPHCDIECVATYTANETNGIIHRSTLSHINQLHLMIDMGEDSLVNDMIKFIPPVKRCPVQGLRVVSSNTSANAEMEFYPLSFGFVERYLPKTTPHQIFIDNEIHTVEQICLPKKYIDFSTLIPGRKETYKFGFESEQDYRRLYGAAYFAVTMKKAGWDCNRHYEIISSGTIPYFDNLNLAGAHTMSLLPKSLLYEAQQLPGVNRQELKINHTLFDINQYNILLHRLLYYAKHRLTTTKIVDYILKVINYPIDSSQRHSILFISHDACDYMKDYMLDGFTRIFGENLHVFDAPEFLYNFPASKMWNAEEVNRYFHRELHAGGFGFKLSLKNYFDLYLRDKKDLPTENVVRERIKSKNFTLIVFGSILRANKLFSVAAKHYDKSKIVIIDGEDEGFRGERIYYAKHGYYFCREIPDNCTQKFI